MDHEPATNPLEALLALIRGEKISADLLLCPGDLAHCAEPKALEYAWEKLQLIRSALGAKLAATTGNHDVDSRYTHNGYDPVETLKQLAPPYPLLNRELNDRYWARHFAVLDLGPSRVLVINSSAFHGGGRPTDAEFRRGRLAEATLREIEKSLSAGGRKQVNILLCHHHPHPHSSIESDGADLMRGGDRLLRRLGSGDHGRWLVVHGHKHHATVEFAAGGNYAPVVFAAGSLSAALTGSLQATSRNQFYTIEIDASAPGPGSPRGTFRAWNWLTGHGWQPAGPADSLPGEGGFGWRGDTERVLAEIKRIALSEGMVSWRQLRSTVAELRHFLPQDVPALLASLEAHQDIVVELKDGLPEYIGKLA